MPHDVDILWLNDNLLIATYLVYLLFSSVINKMWWTYLYKNIYASIATLPCYKYLYIKNAEFKYFHIYCLLINAAKNRVQKLFG